MNSPSRTPLSMNALHIPRMAVFLVARVWVFAVSAAHAESKATRLRVVVTTDFPPICVVKERDVPNVQKSDPDDMQSMVHFLLYTNEFDIASSLP